MKDKATYYEVTVNVNGLNAGDIIWFDKSNPQTAGDKAAIKAGLYRKVTKPSWL